MVCSYRAETCKTTGIDLGVNVKLQFDKSGSHIEIYSSKGGRLDRFEQRLRCSFHSEERLL